MSDDFETMKKISKRLQLEENKQKDYDNILQQYQNVMFNIQQLQWNIRDYGNTYVSNYSTGKDNTEKLYSDIVQQIISDGEFKKIDITNIIFENLVDDMIEYKK